MNAKIRHFSEHYTEVVEDCERFASLPRGVEYQKKSIEKLSSLYAESLDLHNRLIYEEEEEAANQNLMFRCMIDALRYELKMWIDLKEEDWEKAWDALVDAQESAKSARSAHSISTGCNVDEYIDKLTQAENRIFPPQNFNSPELIIENFECSICGEDYQNCGHIAGEPYWGIFCQRVVDNIVTMRASALVDNPKDKKARIREHITDDGMIRDQMTWKKREMTDEEKENYKDESEDSLIFRGILMTADDGPTDFSEYFPE